MNCYVDVPQKLLADAGSLLRKRPELAQTLYDGTREISIDLPASWPRRMIRMATKARMRIGAGDALFELQEVWGSVGGGWMASCMPSSYVAAFLREWIVQAVRRAEPVQMDLFGAAA